MDFAASTDARTNRGVHTPPASEDAPWIRELRRLLPGLRFGSIELTVHEGVVTQIERREKVRLTSTAKTEL